MKEALFWEKADRGYVDCHLCPHLCHIREGQTGTCRVRKNLGGALQSLNYGRYSSIALDPVEKKPLYHFHPGSFLLSTGTVGCNLRCGFCQNWTISQQVGTPTQQVSPAELVATALDAHAEQPNTVGIAYTYNEPFTWYEFVLEAATLARGRGLANVLVTNGYVQAEPLLRLLPFIDAMNIDVKSYTDDYYRKVCGGRLAPVLETVRESVEAGCHVEVTTLLLPGLNDSEEEVEELARWLGALGRGIPLHFSKYFPNYQFDLPPTSDASLVRAREVAMKHLDYVYLGNVWGEMGSNTICPGCGAVVMQRRAMELRAVNMNGTSCARCGREIAVRGKVMRPEGE